jgi:hypothetical protein
MENPISTNSTLNGMGIRLTLKKVFFKATVLMFGKWMFPAGDGGFVRGHDEFIRHQGLHFE